ncbi:unnamed protein product [Spirodela intermedia]|uniref:DYW domain-containing protein n=1 Tax=Spirodela intermedia TaxID=51605 RepID=A0A7I8I889_SPIIN|nr:unnamed protein product [Spirodela intermedia]CAA6653877.1 unnamed protein product [Spirodela intermedia]
MYSVCGNMVSARQLFDGSPVVDSVSWNSILAGYIRGGDSEEALAIFSRMPERNTIASNSMIALLARERRPRDARNLFEKMPVRDVVSWSAIISCFDQNEMHGEALEMFALMNSDGVPVDEVVLVSVLSASASLVAAKEGELVHGLATKTGIDSYLNLNNALINMYSSCFNIPAARRLFDSGLHLDQISANSMLSGYLKCRLIDDAREFFDSMPQKDAVSWSTMVSGYAQNNLFSETLALFQVMQLREFSPDEAALVSVLSACAHLVALKQGKWVHTYIRRHGLVINPILGTTLIDMYMKCGCVEEAVEVFNGIKEKGISSWNAVIIGLATNGMATEALEKFSEMKKLGLAPNEVTFVGVLAACRYLGSVAEGRRFFDSMLEEHKIEPNLRHYGCLVDLLGRAGLLREAEELIERMPMAPDKHGNLEMGERVSRRLIELEPCHDGAHVLLSNLYASSGRWEEAVEVRARMREKKVTKIPGCSLVEAGGTVHEFFAGDGSHPQMRDIERVLNEVARRMRLEGLQPDTSGVHLDIDSEEKETSLHRHSEKLAMAFGLISIPTPTPIRVVKNLRICGDCHLAAKAISRIFQREIVVRDRHLHHHFKGGECSCGDYW